MSGIPLLPSDASEILKLLETSVGFEQFTALLLPGLIAILVYDLRIPGERRKYGEIVLAIVVYSALLDLVGLAAGAGIPHMPAALFIGIFAIFVPGLIGWFAVDLREFLAREGLALSPYPMAWDQIFRRLGSSDELYGLVVTLSDGRKVGGIYDTTSFVSSFPADGDILIGAPCEVEQTSGLFLQRIATSYGLYIKRSDVLTVEVRELKSAFRKQEPSSKPTNERDHGRTENPEMDASSEGTARSEDRDSGVDPHDD